jgi:hypothetical protein
MEVFVPVNWTAVIIAAVVRFILGGIWYAPPVFGRIWQKATGGESPAGTPAVLVVQVLGSLVMAYVLAQVSGHYADADLWSGALIGILMWVGFVLTLTLSMTLLERQPMVSFYIVSGYHLVSLAVMGAIIGAM